jgi:hypothetical protein
LTYRDREHGRIIDLEGSQPEGLAVRGCLQHATYRTGQLVNMTPQPKDFAALCKQEGLAQFTGRETFTNSRRLVSIDALRKLLAALKQ